ncbi:MAG: autotransporter outer membrane beta-barrel domain-containing protein [Kiritimatiellales bacterium]|nr:autotransporter outer membrane beta-barrel domain-containing protein [Kiritimatiellales bacterium]
MKKLLPAIFVFAAGAALAQANGPPAGWSPFARGGSVYHFDAGLDDGGEFSIHRYYAEGGLAYMFRKDRMASFSAGYGQDDYHFTGMATEPWNNIENIRAGVFSRWAFNNAWTAFAVGSVRTYAEKDADLSDALTGAMFVGASFRFSDRLSLGPGLGVVGQLEDDPRYFPILVIDWDITDRLKLSTGGGMAGTAGPGLSLNYEASSHWNFGIAGRYEKKRFRLADRGVAPNGVGEDQSIPIVGSVGYVFYPGTQITGLLGVNLNGKLKVENGNGHSLYRDEYGNSLFSGIKVSVRF